MKRQAAKAKNLTLSKQKLSSRQNGRCPQCFESLFNEEEIQIHHRVTLSGECKPSYNTLVLVHALCHQQIHAETPRKISDCQQHNDRKLPTEESRTTGGFKQESQMGSWGS
jgi:RNA-directed DNA polymerase